MKKICLVVGNTLPVPAVMGGAVEELITMLLDQNEIEQKAEFIIFSRENKKAEREAKKYKYSRIIYIPDDTVLDKVNNRIRRYASSVLKPGTLLDSGYYRKIYHILRNIKCDAIVCEGGLYHEFRQFAKKFGKEKTYLHIHHHVMADPEYDEIFGNIIAVSEFAKKYNCDLALAEGYLKVVRGIRNQQPFYVTDEDGEETGEDVALDDTWNYTDILWNGIQAEKVQRAFEKLNYREQTLLEKRLAICMTCGRVGSWKNRPTFEELAVMFEGSTASGAERSYRKAVDKLTEFLVAEGAIHAVRLKQKSKTKRKKKITAAIYEYQADCDGEWGEMSVDFENGTAEIIRLADWDTIKTNWFANEAIRYILSLSPDALKKYMLVPLEPPLIS